MLSLVLEAQVQEEEELSCVHDFDVVRILEEAGERGGDRVVVGVVR